MTQKYARIFVRGHYLFREENSFPRAKLEENCELRRTDSVQGQMSEHIFAPSGGYCLYYPTNRFRNARSFENRGIFSDIPQFYVGNIRSRDAFRPIARKQKYLMDYKGYYLNLDYLRMQLKWKFDYCFVFFPQKERCDSSTADAFLFDQETEFRYRYYKHTLPNNTSLYLGVNSDCNDDRLSLKSKDNLCKFEWQWWIS